MLPLIRNVLFLCTGNSARSILAEALATELGAGRWKGFSAGSHPKGQVHPLALDTLRAHGLGTDGFRSKSWDEFAGASAPVMDAVITVCDNAANEVCPVWPGRLATEHWSIEDPAAVEGTDDEKRQAFEKVFQDIRTRVTDLLRRPM
jgi:arsenate reductase (thioredoxin)